MALVVIDFLFANLLSCNIYKHFAYDVLLFHENFEFMILVAEYEELNLHDCITDDM